MLVQRWPAVPTAPNSTARRARSRLASFITMTPLLPPSSSSVRPRRLATVSATMRPMRVEPVALINGIAAIFDQALADDGVVSDDELEDAGPAMTREHAIADVLHRNRSQRGLERRLPDDAIAADGGQQCIPRPDRNWEVEG